MADVIEGMPEFGKPEEINPSPQPSLPPELPKSAHQRAHARLREQFPERYCIQIKKDGRKCGVVRHHGAEYCIAHDPAITEEQRQEWRTKPKRLPRFRRETIISKGGFFSREDILKILTQRIKDFILRFGSIQNIEVEEILCNMFRTYALILKVEADESIEAKGWRMKGTA